MDGEKDYINVTAIEESEQKITARLRNEILDLSKNAKLNTKLIEKAYDICADEHSGVYRKSGDMYLIHPVSVTKLLFDYFPRLTSTNLVCAALLHDVVEDSVEIIKGEPQDQEEIEEGRQQKSDELKKVFGEEIVELVDGLTNIRGTEADEVFSLTKFLISITKNFNVIPVKLCDVLHNVSTLYGFDKDAKRKEIATEAILKYLPICQWIGNWRLKQEIEFHAFRYLDEKLEKEIQALKRNRWLELMEFAEKERQKIIKLLTYHKIDFNEYDIVFQHKTNYELYSMMKDGKNIEEIDNIYSIVVPIQTTNKFKTYEVWGILCSFYSNQELIDYIAEPKYNSFEALLTRLSLDNGRILEVMILTDKMQQLNMEGLQLYFSKEKQISPLNIEDSEVKELEEWITDGLVSKKGDDAAQIIMEMIPHNFFTQEVNVICNNKPLKLPKEGTAIDLAFLYDKEKAIYAEKVMLNGKLIQPYYNRFKNKDIVEIVYSDEPKATKTWVNFVKLFLSHFKLHKYFKNSAG